MSTYKYRLIKSSWGIAIDLTARVLSELEANSLNKLVVRPKLYLVADGLGLSQDEQQFLCKGLDLICDKILRENEGIVIEITELSFADTDYQAQGLVYAIAGWAAQEFGFDYAIPDVAYDKAKNRYIFDL